MHLHGIIYYITYIHMYVCMHIPIHNYIASFYNVLLLYCNYMILCHFTPAKNHEKYPTFKKSIIECMIEQNVGKNSITEYPAKC